MISKLIFKQDDITARISDKKWYKSLPEPKQLAFKEGLNVICGMNGEGKSTILEILAKHLAAFRGGYTKPTHWRANSGHDGVKAQFGSSGLQSIVEHDGQGILYISSQAEVGIIGGQFDEDFMLEGIRATVFRGSHGEKTLNFKSKQLLDLASGEDFNSSISENSTSKELFERYLKGSISIGKKTVLIDEPEEGLAFPLVYNLCKKVLTEDFIYKYQIILVTQHPIFIVQGVKPRPLGRGYKPFPAKPGLLTSLPYLT